MRSPFPLQWPEGWKRTESSMRVRSRFGHRSSGDVPFSYAYSELQLELQRLGAANAVITTELPTNTRGVPYASSKVGGEVGVAVWFVLDGQERVNACDQYTTIAENMLAIAKTIEAIRGMARWGSSQLVSRAFAGFTALPPGSGEQVGAVPAPPRKRPWREVLGGAWPAELGKVELLAIAKSRHRAAIAAAHPDRGGDPARAAELNVAFADAETELA